MSGRVTAEEMAQHDTDLGELPAGGRVIWEMCCPNTLVSKLTYFIYFL